MKRIFQQFVAWIIKRLKRGFQGGKPDADFAVSIPEAPSKQRESERLPAAISGHAHESPIGVAAPETSIDRPPEDLERGTQEERQESRREGTPEEKIETAQQAELSAEPPAVSKELSGGTEAAVEVQAFGAETELSEEAKLPAPEVPSVIESAAVVEKIDPPTADKLLESDRVQDATESSVSTALPDNVEMLSNGAAAKIGAVPDLKSTPAEHQMEEPPPIGPDLAAMGGAKATSSELEWDSSSERPRFGSTKQLPPRAKKAGKDASTLLENSGEPTEKIAKAAEAEKSPPEPIDISPYESTGLPAIPDPYLYWNRILLERFVTTAAGGQILLATSPRALAAALFDDTDERVPAAEAQRKFAEAVASAYRIGVLDSRARLKFFRRHTAAGGIPICVGFLALSVLAAHKMHTNETTWSSDYYTRLSELLGVERAGNGQPVDFRGEEFESLWLFLAEWISKQTGWSLVLPQGNIHKRFIAYPLAHVPLRQLDLEKLPTFFEWAKSSPEILPSDQRLLHDLQRWNDSYPGFSNAGREALDDGRRPAVLAQVRSELRSWDGLVADAHGVRHGQVEILLETVGRRSKLSLLAPRREGYPETFICGEVQLAGGDTWYDPLGLKPEDGALLQAGFSWSSEDHPDCVLRGPSALVFALGPNADYSGLVSRAGLPKGVSCSVLCHESVASSVAAYLAGVCDSVPRPFREITWPDGWVLFSKVRAVRRPEAVPPEFAVLDIASEVNIVPLGGLRFGGRWAWIEGAPPRVLIEGHDGQTVYVNETAADLDEEGCVRSAKAFAVPGEYRVKVGSSERKIRILQPNLRPSATPSPFDSSTEIKKQHSVILEPGDWNLVGSVPGNIDTITARGLGSSLAFCDFEPVWAIKLGARKSGTRVIRLVGKPIEASIATLFKNPREAIRWISKKPSSALRWASAIRAASYRQPVVEQRAGEAGSGDTQWGEYVEIARTIKRLWKKGLL